MTSALHLCKIRNSVPRFISGFYQLTVFPIRLHFKHAPLYIGWLFSFPVEHVGQIPIQSGGPSGGGSYWLPADPIIGRLLDGFGSFWAGCHTVWRPCRQQRKKLTSLTEASHKLCCSWICDIFPLLCHNNAWAQLHHVTGNGKTTIGNFIKRTLFAQYTILLSK